MYNVKKVEKLFSKAFVDLKLNAAPVQKMDYKDGSISVSFDFEINDESGDVIVIVDQLENYGVDVITKKYIFANKVYDELELESKNLLIIADSKHKGRIEELGRHMEFANKYLFYNKGINFKVFDSQAFKQILSEVTTVSELITVLRK